MGKDIGVVVARGLNVPNFLKDISRTPKSILRWGTISNLLWSPKEYMNPEKGDRCLNSLGMDVPIVVNDVPKVSTFVLRWGRTSITYCGSPKEYIMIREIGVLIPLGMDAHIFLIFEI